MSSFKIKKNGAGFIPHLLKNPIHSRRGYKIEFFVRDLIIRQKGAGFTLIEILVVISIISFLAVTALYYINDAREKGRIAALLQFSDGIKATLSNSPAAYWSFDKGNAGDGWGQNHGTLNNMDSSNIVKGVVGNALYFNGIDERIRIVSSNLDIFKNPNSWTFEAWIKPTGAGVDDTQTIFNSMWHRPWIAYMKSSNDIQVGILGGPFTWGRSSGNNSIIINKWNHIVLVVKAGDSINGFKWYINGKKTNIYPYEVIYGNSTNGTYQIGDANAFRFQGSIDEVKIYTEALPFAQIENHYAEGVKKFNLAVKFN